MRRLLILIAALMMAMPAARADDVIALGREYLGWGRNKGGVERTLKVFHYGYDSELVLQRASAAGFSPAGMSRLQFRNEYGRIVAYTPTRITAIPFCPARQSCWVFLWKTVYPLPAIYKFQTDPTQWVQDGRAPMKYTRRGGGHGFKEQFNPLFGLYGVLLLILTYFPHFAGCIVLTLILTAQIHKYHGLPERYKIWVKRIFIMLSTILPGPLTVEPYMLTALAVSGLGVYGTYWVGIPFVVTILIIFTTFFMASLRVARQKQRQQSSGRV